VKANVRQLAASESDDSVFGVVELQSVRGVGEFHLVPTWRSEAGGE
jgi:hypothetical protein